MVVYRTRVEPRPPEERSSAPCARQQPGPAQRLSSAHPSPVPDSTLSLATYWWDGRGPSTLARTRGRHASPPGHATLPRDVTVSDSASERHLARRAPAKPGTSIPGLAPRGRRARARARQGCCHHLGPARLPRRTLDLIEAVALSSSAPSRLARCAHAYGGALQGLPAMWNHLSAE